MKINDNSELKPATTAQLKFIKNLIKTKEVNEDLVVDMRKIYKQGLMTVAVASQFITLLRNCPLKDEDYWSDVNYMPNYDWA